MAFSIMPASCTTTPYKNNFSFFVLMGTSKLKRRSIWPSKSTKFGYVLSVLWKIYLQHECIHFSYPVAELLRHFSGWVWDFHCQLMRVLVWFTSGSVDHMACQELAFEKHIQYQPFSMEKLISLTSWSPTFQTWEKSIQNLQLHSIFCLLTILPAVFYYIIIL